MTTSRREFFMQATAAGMTAAASSDILAATSPKSAGPPRPDTARCAPVVAPMREVSGKVAFITGGSSGIGLGIARAFVEAGMKVAIGYRTKRHRDEAMDVLGDADGRVHAINVDVTDRPGMEAAAAEIVHVFGKVHVLVNNAGGQCYKPLSLATYEDWDWLIGTNLTGVFNGVRAFLPRMRAHEDGGQIVTTSSVMGLFTAHSQGLYSASKFAAVALMEALRVELLEEQANIGVSVLCPGNVWARLDARNRPGYRPAGNSPQNADDPDEKLRKEHPDQQMDPLEAGRLTLRGMRNNDLYILTHPEFESMIKERNDALIAAHPTDLRPPKARVDYVNAVFKNPIYAAERDRKNCRSYTS